MNVEALFVHPIKSCAAVAVPSARVGARGLVGDRRWMVTDEAGLFQTQRTMPEMALVRIAIDEGGALTVTRGELPPLLLPPLATDGARVEVEVWGDRVAALRHDAGSAWFTHALGRPLQLVCMPDDAERPVEPEYAQPGDIVSFADGFPLLVVNRASLDALGDTDVRRFRPNVVVAGAAPWAEDGWRALRIGAVTLRTPKPCARCAIPGVDPDTAQTTREPVRTLARLRTRDHQVFFGINAIPDGSGLIRVGDAVTVL